MRFLRRVVGMGLVALVAGAPAALAQMATTPSAMSEVAGGESGLGSSHRFASATAAAAHCPGDVVVWASAKRLVYWPTSSPFYGKKVGFYACQAEADTAGFSRAKG